MEAAQASPGGWRQHLQVAADRGAEDPVGGRPAGWPHLAVAAFADLAARRGDDGLEDKRGLVGPAPDERRRPANLAAAAE